MQHSKEFTQIITRMISNVISAEDACIREIELQINQLFNNGTVIPFDFTNLNTRCGLISSASTALDYRTNVSSKWGTDYDMLSSISSLIDDNIIIINRAATCSNILIGILSKIKENFYLQFATMSSDDTTKISRRIDSIDVIRNELDTLYKYDATMQDVYSKIITSSKSSNKIFGIIHKIFH